MSGFPGSGFPGSGFPGAPAPPDREIGDITNRLAASSSPAPPRSVPLPTPPPQQHDVGLTGAILASAGILLATLGSRRTAFPMASAIRSAAAAMQGYQSGRQQIWQQRRAEYRDSLNAALAQNAEELRAYNEAIIAGRSDAQRLRDALYALSLEHQDDMMRATLEQRGIANSIQLLRDRHTWQAELGKLNLQRQLYGLPPEQGGEQGSEQGGDLSNRESAADRKYGLPPGTMKSIGQTESSQGKLSYNTFQVQPSTASQPGFGVPPITDPSDPDQAASYLHGLLIGPAKGDLPTAFAMYHGGPASPTPYAESSPAARFLAGLSSPQSVPGGLTADSLEMIALRFMEQAQLPSGLTPFQRQAVFRRAGEIQKHLNDVLSMSPGVSGTSYLQAIAKVDPNLAATIGAIRDGRYPVPTSPFAMRTPYWTATFSIANRVDPSLDAANYPNRVKTMQSFLTGQNGFIRTSINRALAHAGTMLDAAQKMGNIALPGVNWLKNVAMTQLGSPIVTNYDTAKNEFVRELERVFRGSGGSTEDIKMIMSTFDAAESPAQIKGAVRQAVELLRGQMDALAYTFEQGTKIRTSGLDLLNPQAKTVYQRVMGAGGPAPPVPSYPTLPGHYWFNSQTNQIVPSP